MLRGGARTLLAHAVEAEVAAFVDRYAGECMPDGRRRLVRHGHLPEREVMTGTGPVAAPAPRVRDREGRDEARNRVSCCASLELGCESSVISVG